MNFSWLLNRLKLMSIGEVVYRSGQSLLSRIEKQRLKHGWQPLPDSPVTASQAMINRASIDAFSNRLSESAAEQLLLGKLSLFGYHELDVGRPIDWHRDPLTGIRSPSTEFGKTINYRDDTKVGDIKVLWELGRQQYLVPLAVEYCYTRDPILLKIMSEVLSSWLGENRYGYGVHWCSSLEVSLRGISWAISHQFLMAAGIPQGLFSLDLDVSYMKTQIYQHAFFIRGHLSLYSSANNHLIGELTGLHVLCSSFNFGIQSDQWRAFAWTSLLAESERQVYRDGVQKEQALYYHCWVLEYFIINYLVANLNQTHIPDSFISLITKMGQFVNDLAPMGMEPPQIGDSDDGVAILFSHDPSSFHRDLIETVNALADTTPLVHVGNKASFYMCFERTVISPRPESLHVTNYPAYYPQGGYAVLGAAHFHVVFDSGALGYPSIAAHGHADMLNVCLAIDGLWWLVDPGTYSYHSDHGWRNYFRGSLAHNVLSISERDQSTIGGPFMWVKRANAHFDKTMSKAGKQCVSGWHDGYSALGVPRVGRSLNVDAAALKLTIVDEVDCGSETDLTIHYHFSPEVTCLDICGSIVTLERQGSDKRIVMEFSPGLVLSSYRGDTQTKLGWYSSNLGKREPCLTLRAGTKISTTTSFTTIITVVGNP